MSLHVSVKARGLTLAHIDGWLGVVQVCGLQWAHSVMEAVCMAHGVRDLLSV